MKDIYKELSVGSLGQVFSELATFSEEYNADVRAAAIWRKAAYLLGIAIHSEEDKIVTVTQAARERGYNSEYLARLVREGKIENHGRKHAPRVRIGDIPMKKSSTRAVQAKPDIDVRAIVREIIERGRGTKTNP